jgi:hypothetical protein
MVDYTDAPAQPEERGEQPGERGEQPGGLNISSSFPLPGYISYETRKTGLFGKYYKNTYVKNGKVYHEREYLGKVENIDLGIFQNRRRGLFSFTLDNGYGTAPESIGHQSSIFPPHMIYDFGDMWLIDQILKQSGIDKVLENLIPSKSDTLKTIVAYKLLETKANSFASNWYPKSYARVLYPEANLDSPRISEFLAALGSEHVNTEFFKQYLGTILKNRIVSEQIKIPVIIDSVGIKNDIDIFLTAPSNHGNGTSNELRVTYVVDKQTKLPIFFRISPGNIIDNSLLIGTVHKLSDLGIEVDLVIMDAGYAAFDNLSQLISEDISFLTRIPQNRVMYKQLIEEHSSTLALPNNLVTYNGRVLYVKKVETDLNGHKLFAYFMQDIKQAADDLSRAFLKHELSDNRIVLLSEEQLNAGKFALLSSREYSVNEVLAEYYTRQTVEQIFDVNKNYAGGEPVRAHTEETVRGTILVSFISTLLYTIISQKLIGTKLSATATLSIMGKLRMTVHEHGQFDEERTKEQNFIFKHLNLENPLTDNCPDGVTVKNLNFSELKAGKRVRGRPRKNKESPGGYSPDVEVNNAETTSLSSERSHRRGRPKGSKNRTKAGMRISSEDTSTNKSPQVTVLEEPRRRGRPKGSKNKPKNDLNIPLETNAEGSCQRGRGRPKGSKNKPKAGMD